MDMSQLIRFGIVASMMLLVFALGVRSTEHLVGYLLRRPALLVRSLLAMNVILPLITVVLALSFRLHTAVRIALVALAISPVPPFLPAKQLKLSSSAGYVYGLFVTAAVLAVVLVPLTMALISALMSNGKPYVSARRVMFIVSMSVLLPLVAGMLVRRLLPSAAGRISSVANLTGSVLLAIAFLPVLVVQWPSMRALIGDGTLLAIVVFTLLGLLVGHLLGGPDAEHRTVLALATASRHPAVALSVASASFPDEKLVPAAVLLALIVGLIATAPYSAWRKSVHAAQVVSDAESTPAAGRR